MTALGAAAEFVAMRTRRILDEADARRCLAAVAATGTSAVEWCRHNAIDARSLNAWRINLQRREHVFIELVPSAPPTATAGARYMLEVGEVRLHFDDECSAATLRRALEVVRSC
jgi:transposase-like protein